MRAKSMRGTVDGWKDVVERIVVLTRWGGVVSTEVVVGVVAVELESLVSDTVGILF